MKKIEKIGLLLLASTIAFSCSQIEEDVDINLISNGTTTFNIVKGYKKPAFDDGNSTSYRYDVLLSDGNVVFSDSTTGFSGIGSIVKFSVFSPVEYDIAPGNYTIDAFLSQDTLTASNCVVYTNYNFSADTGSTSNITGGIVEFINLGATIKIRLDLVENYSSSMYQGVFQGILDN